MNPNNRQVGGAKKCRITDEVRAIADILWQFHNDRLKDPSIKEMKPYIEPIQSLIKDNSKQLLGRILEQKARVLWTERQPSVSGEIVPAHIIESELEKL